MAKGTRRKPATAAGRTRRKAPGRRSAAAGLPAGTTAARRIDQYIADLGDWRGETLAAMRKLIHQVDPEVVEDWKWRGTPVWSHEGMYVLANGHKDKVKLTFLHGARLPDPARLFNAGLGGGRWRAIDIRQEDRLNRAALRTLLKEAVAYNLSHRVPKSRGSRVRGARTGG